MAQDLQPTSPPRGRLDRQRQQLQEVRRMRQRCHRKTWSPSSDEIEWLCGGYLVSTSIDFFFMFWVKKTCGRYNCVIIPNILLVGGIPTPLKNMSSSMGRIIPYMKWKIIKIMFQTTNQLIYIYCYYRWSLEDPCWCTHLPSHTLLSTAAK